MFAALTLAPSGAVEAHTGERAFVLILPTHLYIVGGALVVALSFVVVAFVPSAGLRALERARWRLGDLPRWNATAASGVALVVVLGLIIAGFVGSRDPLANPLPPVI